MQEKPEQHSQIDIPLYLGIISERRNFALAVFVLVASLVTWGSLLVPNVYEAKSLVLVERSQVLTPLLQGMAVESRSEALMNSLRDNMLSRNIVEKAIKKGELDIKASTPAKYEALIAELQNNVDIRVPKGPRGQTDLFEVSFRGVDPEIVRNAVNSLVSSFIEANMGSSRGETYKAIEFIQGQILYYKEKLDEADRELREFQERNPGVLNINQNALLERIRGLRTRLSEEELTLKGYLKEKESIEAQLSGEEPLAATTMTRESSPERRLSEAKARLESMLARYTSKHPEVVALKSEIEEIEAGLKHQGPASGTSFDTQEVGINPIYQQLKERLSQTQTNIDLQGARIKELTSQVERDEQRMKTIPKEQEEYTRLSRGREVYQNMYDTLMAKLESARVSKEMEEADKGESFRVLDPAILPTRPVKPDRVKIILFGFILALGTAIGGPIGLEFLRPTFRNVKTVEDSLGVRVIGTVPQINVGPELSMAGRRWRFAFGGTLLYVLILMLVLVREFMFQRTGQHILF